MDPTPCQDLESAAGRAGGGLSFTDIPRSTRLFTDFLYDYPKVSRFYSNIGRRDASLVEHARRVGAREFDRLRVPDALERINKEAGSPDLTFSNIDLLRRPGSVAIVTGQQAGLFTGPMYTIHKALTVIKLARCLREAGIDAVPVFWIASEDHDYQEVNHCRVVDREGKLSEVRYEACLHDEDIPVGEIQLCEGISARIDDFISLLPPSEFVPEIERDLRESYAHGGGFAQGFARLMARIFRDHGVVLLDPRDEELKQVSAPLYSAALEKSEEVARALVDRSRELEEAGYHAQIHVSDEMVPLFIMDNGRRIALTGHNGAFVQKAGDRSYAREELVELSAKCPNCFSPNVTLRPVVQDYLLPTAAYIGGPAEIAYFAQLQVVYRVLGRQEPCVLPRSSLTVVEGRHQKTMKKYQLELADFFDGLHPAVSKVVERSLDRDTSGRFPETERTINSQLDELEKSLKAADPTLAASLVRARRKILHQIEHLRTRFIHSSARREEAVYRQVERAYLTLYPDRTLQERVINFYYFLSRYGPGLLEDLYNATEVGFGNHRLVNLGGVASQVVNPRT